jgi:hypothetical protein
MIMTSVPVLRPVPLFHHTRSKDKELTITWSLDLFSTRHYLHLLLSLPPRPPPGNLSNCGCNLIELQPRQLQVPRDSVVQDSPASTSGSATGVGERRG